MTTYEFLAPWPKAQAKYVEEFKSNTRALRVVVDELVFEADAFLDGGGGEAERRFMDALQKYKNWKFKQSIGSDS